jgi:hypothetical protein
VSVTPTGGSATNVLSSSFVNVASPLEPINSVVIAGPATVSIKAGSTTTFVTYIKQHDSD